MLSGLDDDSSVGKALTILDCYGSSDRELGVSELSRRTDLAKSTVHRLCLHLTKAGYLTRTASRGFALGLKVFELGSAAVAPFSPSIDSSRFLHQFSSLTGETSHLAILDGAEVVYLDKIETMRSREVPSRVGQRNPAHCTGLGKALLAWNRTACDLLPTSNGKLVACTPNTITSVAQLHQELTHVNTTGVAYDNEERTLGVVCVAAPVRNRLGSVVAAISVAGPKERITAERLPQLSHLVREGAARLSVLNGWRPKETTTSGAA